MSYLNKIVKYDLATSSEPSHVYMDVAIINADTGTLPPTHLKFTETRDRAILTDPASYYMSCIRFHIDTIALPAMCPIVQLNQPDINRLIYSFTLSYKGFDFQQFVEFIPQDKTTKIPAAPYGKQDIDSGYYYLSSFAFFVNLCNNALKSAFAGLAAQVTLPTTNAPWLLYDPTSKEMIFNADVVGFDNSLTDYIQIYFNIPCYNLFCSFETTTESFNSPNGKNYLLVMENENGTNTSEMNTYNALQVYQEFPSSITWSCIQSIVLCSSTLPINGAMQSQNTINQVKSEAINYSNNLSVNIISDFEVAMESGMDFKPSINYAPYLYRLIDMFGHQEINTISVEVYWKDTNNNMHPLLLPSNSNANIKLLFRKKYLGI